MLSDDRQRPDWLRPNVNWLPWGDEQYPKLVAYRNMCLRTVANCGFNFDFPTLPDRTVLDDQGPCSQQEMGDYYPVAVWCDKSKFLAGGWKACIKDALH